MSDQDSDAAASPRGVLKISWLQFTLPPWISYRVMVDGYERGRVGSRRPPAKIDVEPGKHSVVVRNRRYASKPFDVELTAGTSADLYSGFRPLPRLMGFRQATRWGREHMLWVSESAVAPRLNPTLEPRPAGTHRWIPSLMAAVFFAAVAISQGATGQYWKMIGAFALALGGAFGSRRDFKRARSSPI